VIAARGASVLGRVSAKPVIQVAVIAIGIAVLEYILFITAWLVPTW
jgi:hypothetical protein